MSLNLIYISISLNYSFILHFTLIDTPGIVYFFILIILYRISLSKPNPYSYIIIYTNFRRDIYAYLFHHIASLNKSFMLFYTIYT